MQEQFMQEVMSKLRLRTNNSHMFPDSKIRAKLLEFLAMRPAVLFSKKRGLRYARFRRLR
jgi:hypothetical protein